MTLQDLSTTPASLRTLLTVKHVTAWLGFPSEDACRAYLRRHHIPHLTRGRVILIDPRDLEVDLRRVDRCVERVR